MSVSLKEQAFESLNNAKDNGYDYSNMKSDHALEQIANDMIELDTSFRGVKPAQLIPLIKEWQITQVIQAT